MERTTKTTLAVALAVTMAMGITACHVHRSGEVVATQGQVCFNVQPADAIIEVDGVVVGRANDYMPGKGCLELARGPHTIRISKEHFTTYERRIVVGAATQTVSVKLVNVHKGPGNQPGPPPKVSGPPPKQPGPPPKVSGPPPKVAPGAPHAITGTVCFDVQPADATIEVDGVVVGKANQFTSQKGCLALARGPHTIRISKDNFEPYERRGNMGNSTQTVTVKLEKAQGKQPGPPAKVKGPQPKLSGPPPAQQGPPPKVAGPPPKVAGPPPKVAGPPPKVAGPAPKQPGPPEKQPEPLPRMSKTLPQKPESSVKAAPTPEPQAKQPVQPPKQPEPVAKQQGPQAKQPGPPGKQQGPQPKAAPAPAPPQKQAAAGSICFDVQPDDALVEVDGVARGKAGQFTAGKGCLPMNNGVHVVKVSKDKYETIEKRINVGDGSQTVSIKLKTEKGPSGKKPK